MGRIMDKLGIGVKAVVPIEEKPRKESQDCPLERQRADFFADVLSGKSVYCPTCDKKGVLNKESVDRSKCIWLWKLVEEFRRTGEYVHVSKIIPHLLGGKSSSGGTRFRHWAPCLAEMKPNDDDPAKNCSGLWRPTQAGIDFVDGFNQPNPFSIPKSALFYNGLPCEFDNEMVNIREGFGKDFDFSEIHEPLSQGVTE